MISERTLLAPLRICAALLGLGFIVAISRAMQHTISCFMLAFVIAYLLDPLVVMAEQRGFRRSPSICYLYVLLSLLSILVFAFFLPYLSLSADSMIRDIPHYLGRGKELLLLLKGSLGPRFDTPEAAWLMDHIAGGMDKLAGKIGALGYAALTRTLFNIFNLVLSPILVFFMLLYKHQIISGLARWLPQEQREAILQAGRETDAAVSGYLKGQMIVSLIVAVLSAIALYLLDVDYAVLNGIFAGLASILPFIGVIIAMLPALFFAYVKFQSGLILLKIIGAFSVIYFLEGYLVKPLVFKEAMDLNPLTTIIMVMACGELFGFWGILLAIPLAAGIKIFANYAKRGSFASQEIE